MKIAYTNGSRSIGRKIVEAALANQVEQKWSKDHILTEYLNIVYFGHQAYGVEAAARVYFGTHARSLTGWQAALLAGMSRRRATTTRWPTRHSRASAVSRSSTTCSPRVTSRRPSTCSGRGSHCSRPATRWRFRPRAGASRRTSRSTSRASWWPGSAGGARIGGGLKVYTTFNLHQQQIAKQAVRQVLGHQDWTRRNQWPAGALAAIDPRNGQLKAIVGGSDFSQSQFDLATEARRQPGSSFKPFVLLAALGEGIQPQTHFHLEAAVHPARLTAVARDATTPRATWARSR